MIRRAELDDAQRYHSKNDGKSSMVHERSPAGTISEVSEMRDPELEP